jgi:hypothetical protein
MTKVRTISETDEVSKLFGELEKIAKDSNIPFSKMLGICVKGYLNSPIIIEGKNIKEEIKLFDKIEKIRKLINEAKGEDLIKIQKRHQQIGTLLNMRVSKLL